MGDSYRPGPRGGNEYRRVPPPNQQPKSKPLEARISFGDNYRPARNGRDAPRSGNGQQRRNRQDGSDHPSLNAPRGDFTFRSNHPTPQFPSGNGQPSGAQRSTRSSRPPWKKGVHERPLLQAPMETGSFHVLGVATGSARFMDPNDLSESEGEMDIESEADDFNNASDTKQSSPSEDGEVLIPKKARIQGQTKADGDSVPKWSNPDPYTVLPPTDDSGGKKKDFVQLIRKAKLAQSEKAGPSNAVTDNDDFISFNDDDDESQLRPFQDMTSARLQSDLSTDLAAQADHPKGPRKRQREEDIGILREWLPKPNRSGTPWCDVTDNSRVDDMTQWLHNEIQDFHDFVSPRPYEGEARSDIVNRIADTVQYNCPNSSVYCFGSFAAGFYLPTADMDLVIVSSQYASGGPKLYSTKNYLYRVSNTLQRRSIASTEAPVQVIARAKVPIIKFIDAQTRLHVDISFENLDGVQAQDTFKLWKSQYPAMPALVSLIKQFLVMHGMNEVNTGGLGGFSVICLVVSLLHHHNTATENLGELFLSFLDFYGNKFDLARTMIIMDPIGFGTKQKYGVDGRLEQPDKLTIVDPNRPDNNISGGSHKVKKIFELFSQAHTAIEDRMVIARIERKAKSSLLEPIFAGDYSSYDEQRKRLKSQHDRLTSRFNNARRP